MPDETVTSLTAAGIAGAVDRKAGVIRGYSLLTLGDAGGHGWIDGVLLDQVVTAAQAMPKGLKTRFQHPNIVEDHLFDHAGRTRNIHRAGDRVLGDLHFAAAADPKKVKFIMDLADEDPEAFGASLEFLRDRDAESAFQDQHDDDDGFESPDDGNTRNATHVRLAKLKAVAVVYDPGANESFLSEKRPCSGCKFECAHTEAVGNGPAGDQPSPPNEELAMADEVTKEAAEAQAAALREEGEKAGQDRLARLQEKFGDDRSDFVLKEFAAGHDVPEAESAFKDVLLKERDAEIAELKAAKPETEQGTAPVAFGEPPGEGTTLSYDQLVTMWQVEHPGTSLDAAMIEISKRRPDLANAVCMPAGKATWSE